MPAGLASSCRGASLFTIILGAFVFGERLQGKQLAGIALVIFLACWCWWRGAWRGACPTGGLYADPGGGAQLGLRQYFQKNHVPGDPPANHIAGGVERIDPGAAVYVCLVADRWPAAHAGESTPDRYADGSLAVYLAFIATLVGGIWGSLLGRYETWRVAPLSLLVPVVGMASAALLLGETLSGLQLAGAALIMAGLYINVFGLRLVRPGMARG